MADEATPAAAEIKTVAPADALAPVVPVVEAPAAVTPAVAPASPPPVVPTKADDPAPAAFADPDDDGDTDNFAAGEPVKPGEEPAPATRTRQRKPVELVDGPPGEDEPAASPAAKPAKAAKEPAAPASPAAPADESMIARAADYGFTAKDIEDLGEDHVLKAMTAYDRLQSARVKAELAKQTPPAAPAAAPTLTPVAPAQPSAVPPSAPTAPVAATPAQPSAPTAPSADEISKLDLALDDSWDEETKATLQKINDHYHGIAVRQEAAIRAEQQRLAAIADQNAQHASRFQAEAAQRFEAEMDSFFNELPGFEEVFGRGTVRSLPPEARQQRIAVVREMEALAMADHQLGRQPASPAVLKQRAVRSLHGDRIETNARDKIILQVEKRRSQAVARPTGGATIDKSPERRAAERANQFYKDRGIDIEERNEEFAEI